MVPMMPALPAAPAAPATPTPPPAHRGTGAASSIFSAFRHRHQHQPLPLGPSALPRVPSAIAPPSEHTSRDAASAASDDDETSSVATADAADDAAALQEGRRHQPRGTPAFQAPELLNDAAQAPTHESDLWALGVTLFGLRYGRLPFAGNSLRDLRAAVNAGELPFPTTMTAADTAERRWRSLLRGLLCPDPAQRTPVETLLGSSLLS